VKIAVFVSGRGSNLQAILDAADAGNYHVDAVVSNKIDCPAFQRVGNLNIPTFSVANKEKPGCISFRSLLQVLKEKKIELIVLAGYLKLIPPELVRHFEYRIINIHPALLPSFGGKGMYGMNVHEAVFRSGAKISGPTIHFVNEEYDKGYIIAQSAVDISQTETPEEIASLVLQEEHKLLPFVIGKFAEGKVLVKGTRVFIEQ
jgi:formyltetrahydrofolate-dependent phosphoribosylglycinamide formyltransferase